MLTPILNDPLFGLALTIFAFYLGRKLFLWKPIVIFNPILFGPVIIMLLITSTNITYEQYNNGAHIITYLLGPATVALGVPLYKRLPLVKRNLKAMVVGTVVASVSSVISVIIIGKLFDLSNTTLYSLVGKSVTAPISLGIIAKLGGLEQILILSVVTTGIFGGIIGAEVLRAIGIKSKVSTGFSLGAAAHAAGTARAFLLGPREGTFSGIAMVLVGLGVAIVAPILTYLLIQ